VLVRNAVQQGACRASLAAAPALIELLDRADTRFAPRTLLGLLAQIAVGDPDAVACGADGYPGLALDAPAEELQAERDGRRRCAEAVDSGAEVYLRWLGSNEAAERCAAAHLLAFVAHPNRSVDQALGVHARDLGEQTSVRASALFALGLRGGACAETLPPLDADDLRKPGLLAAALAFAALGGRDTPLVSGAESAAVELLARGVLGCNERERLVREQFPWPGPDRLLLGRLARGKGRSARAQSALLRMLAAATDRESAERVASALLVLAFGEPTAAAFSQLRPSLEVFRGASSWSAEQRAVLRVIVATDVLWPASAENGPSVRHLEACAVQVELKRMLELSYYPSRKGVRSAIALVLSAGAGGVGR
jgi:hypothetical protein